MSVPPDARSFAVVFREALAARGATLTWLRDRLAERGYGISLAALSYWRSSARTPNQITQGATIAAVEDILALRPDVLVDLAARPVRLPAMPDPAVRFAAAEQGDDLPRVLAEATTLLNAAPNTQFRERSMQQITDVGVDGYPAATTMQAVIQCVDGVMTRIMYATLASTGVADRMTLDAVAGGRVNARYVSPKRQLTAVGIDLDSPLHAGDIAVVAIHVGYVPGDPTEQRMSVGINRRADKVVNWIRFHPDAIPDWCQESEADAEGDRLRPRALDTPTTVHQVRWDFGPGSIGLEWGYGEPPADA